MKIYILKLIYLILCISILVYFEHGLDGKYDNESYILFGIIMTVIGFPLTIIGGILYAMLEVLISNWISIAYSVRIFVLWLVLLATGYIQWFILLPKLIKLFRN